MKTLRVGLIGCGQIAQDVHLRSLAGLPGVVVAALAEPDAERRESARRRAPEAVAVAEYRELLAMPEVEAVVISAPTGCHAEIAVASLEAGKHIYLEKPIATNLDEARTVLAAWRRSGVVGMIGFNSRFHPLYREARRHLQAGTLGDLVGVRSVFSTAVRPLPSWKAARRSGGGVLLDLASHHIDRVRFLFAQAPRAVFAGLRSQRSEEDTATLDVELSDGLRIQSLFSLCAVHENRLEVYGTAGKLTVDRYVSLDVEITPPVCRHPRLARWGAELRSLRHVARRLQQHRSPGHEPSYLAALGHFVQAVQEGQPASPDLWDGYQSLRVVAAAEESARTGRAVELAELAAEVPAPVLALTGHHRCEKTAW